MSLRDGYFFQEVGKYLEPSRGAEAFFLMQVVVQYGTLRKQ